MKQRNSLYSSALLESSRARKRGVLRLGKVWGECERGIGKKA